MNENTILLTNHLSKRFRSFKAVDDLCLSINRGDIFGFLGPNGAGKSTTIRMILGLIRPTSGGIQLFGRSLSKNRVQILSRIGALVEKPSFYGYLSARRNLEIFGTLMNRKANQNDIDRVLDIVALKGRADHKVNTYSQGMKQRLGVAQALLGYPEFIVLDEPTSGLDPKGIKEIRNLIIQLADQGLTIFLSSHILHEVEQMCDKMAIINKGRLVIQGKVKDLLASEADIYRIKVDKPAEALRLFNEKGVFESDMLSNTLMVKTEEDHIPEIVETIVKSGIRIYSIQPERSLEDYYLSLLEADRV